MKKFHYLSNMPELQSLAVDESGGKRHYISPNGIKLPSVTTVLGHFKKEGLATWRDRIGDVEADKIMNRAATRGTKFHLMMERYLSNEKNIFENVMPDMKQAFRDVQPILDKIDNIHYLESPLYSEVLGVAGRTDVIGEFDGIPSIIDFKTSLKPKKKEWIGSYFEQGTAYSLMYEELTGIQIYQIVIIISVDGTDEPQVFVEDRIDYVDVLMRKIDIYKKEFGYHVS